MSSIFYLKIIGLFGLLIKDWKIFLMYVYYLNIYKEWFNLGIFMNKVVKIFYVSCIVLCFYGIV